MLATEAGIYKSNVTSWSLAGSKQRDEYSRMPRIRSAPMNAQHSGDVINDAHQKSFFRTKSAVISSGCPLLGKNLACWGSGGVRILVIFKREQLPYSLQLSGANMRKAHAGSELFIHSDDYAGGINFELSPGELEGYANGGAGLDVPAELKEYSSLADV